MHRATGLAWICGAISACGGGVAAQPTDAGITVDAGVRPEGGSSPEANASPGSPEAGGTPDAASAETGIEDSGAPPPCPPSKPFSCAAVEACLSTIKGALDGGAEGWLFDDQSYMTNFFRGIAVANHICTSVSTCTYDPFAQSNALGQLVGPDGLAYVWTWISSRGQYILVREDQNPTGYDIILDANECDGDGRVADGGGG